MWPAPTTTHQIRIPPSPLGLIGTHTREEGFEAAEVIELAEGGGDLHWESRASGTSDSAFANSALFCIKDFPREKHKFDEGVASRNLCSQSRKIHNKYGG